MERHLDDIRAKWTPYRLLKRDIFLYVSIGSPILFFIVFFQLSTEGAESGHKLGDNLVLNLLFIMAILSIIYGLIIIWWRIRIYSKIMSKGIEIPAKMSVVRFFGPNAGIEYIYSLNGQNYASTRDMSPHLVRKMKFQSGRAVRLIIDPDKPKRFIILDVL